MFELKSLIFISGFFMNTEEKIELYKNLKELVDGDKLKNKYIVLFGANKPSELTMDFLDKHNISVNAVIDNSDKAKGSVLYHKTGNGAEVSKPDEKLGEYREDAVILIGSQYYTAMCEQLREMGYKENVNIFKTIEYSGFNCEKRIDEINIGLELYLSLLDKYGEDAVIYTCHYSGIGDAYMLCSYLKEHLRKYNIKNHILVVAGKTASEIAEFFNIENIEILTVKQILYLTYLVQFMGFDNVKINTLPQQAGFHINNVFYYMSKKIRFNEWYKQIMFRLPKETNETVPVFNHNEEYTLKLFKENNLLKGRTVIIAPYAYNVHRLSDVFWEKLSERLREEGYSVCTNCSADDEVPIKNTTPLKIPLENLYDVLKNAGYFIGLRSGLCDFVCKSDCKKIFIYSDSVSAFYFSLSDLDKKALAKELIYKNNDDELLKSIFDFLSYSQST